MIFIKENEPGQTGKISPGKILGVFWLAIAAFISLEYLHIIPTAAELTFWNWLIGSFVFGVLGVGFYFGKARDAFNGVIEAIKHKIKGS